MVIGVFWSEKCEILPNFSIFAKNDKIGIFEAIFQVKGKIISKNGWTYGKSSWRDTFTHKSSAL